MALLPPEPDRRRKVLLGTLLVGLLGYAAFEYLHKPGTDQVSLLEARLTQLHLYNQGARGVATDAVLSELEQEVVRYQEQLRLMETLIPRAVEVPDLLDAISAEAEKSEVQLLLLQPTGAAEEEFYVRRTYDLAVLGAYHEIGDFLSRIASLPRMVTPSGLSLVPRQEPGNRRDVRLEGRFSIETYVIPTHSPADEVALAR
jgi:type IV pilus assembly protein PilO